jgi:hypothetical protein
MLSIFLIQSFINFYPLKHKAKSIFINCDYTHSSYNNLIYPSHVFDYNSYNYNYENLKLNSDLHEEEPEHISMDNLYFEKKGPEVIIDPYNDLPKDDSAY